MRVPLVIGERFEEASDALDEVGLDAEENSGGFPFRRENGVVIGQEPGPGSLVDPGTTITLRHDLRTGPGRALRQPRSISATRNASSSDCWVLSRGSQAVS